MVGLENKLISLIKERNRKERWQSPRVYSLTREINGLVAGFILDVLKDSKDHRYTPRLCTVDDMPFDKETRRKINMRIVREDLVTYMDLSEKLGKRSDNKISRWDIYRAFILVSDKITTVKLYEYRDSQDPDYDIVLEAYKLK